MDHFKDFVQEILILSGIGELGKRNSYESEQIFDYYLVFEFKNIQPATYVTWGYKRGGANKPRTKPRVDDEEEEVQVKRQGCKLTEEQLIHTEQFRKSHIPPRNILRFFREQKGVLCRKKIYNAIRKIKRNKMQGQNTVEEVLCLSA
ncbi:hypothetical protein M9H77_08433 [Catharanthus roseus]|uniref:Uncharacterized protein n=1 Tax=Catharanthus roseus TaxID=4058 RepID=A0ACC0BXS2_CATRO|nr:hypothetical protein M9H77_08433 [Catharanthus roseus]